VERKRFFVSFKKKNLFCNIINVNHKCGSIVTLRFAQARLKKKEKERKKKDLHNVPYVVLESVAKCLNQWQA
jgi:hypothetical protein